MDTTDKPLSEDVARRLQSALTAGSETLFQIVQDPSPVVLRACLKNRHLRVEHLVALLKRRDLPEDLVKAVSLSELGKSSHALKVALAGNPAAPGSLVRSVLPHLYLFELLDLCSLPGVTPDQKLAAERVIIQRLAVTPLGNKLTLARRGTAALVEALLKEGDLRLIEPCLHNPRLREVSVLQFLGGGRASAEAISAVARNSRWKNRPNIRDALLKNPKTPHVWFNVLLPGLPTANLHAILRSKRLSAGQKSLVTRELKKRGLA